MLWGVIGNSPVFSIRAGASCHLRAAKWRSKRKKTVSEQHQSCRHMVGLLMGTAPVTTANASWEDPLVS